jgi:hypothetical protein
LTPVGISPLHPSDSNLRGRSTLASVLLPGELALKAAQPVVLALAKSGTAEHTAVGVRDGGNHLRIDANYTPPRDEFEQQLYRGEART